jgi:hypothetical protein
MPALRKKAKQGDAEAQYSLGVMHKIGWGVQRDEAESAKWYRKAAKQGHAGALLYAPSDDDGADWERKAAEQGHADAQYFLGGRYENGRVVTQNYAEAAKWYRKAAELGRADAQYRLGMMYDAGRGVKQDHAEAEKWLREAAAREHAEALRELDRRGIKKPDRR